MIGVSLLERAEAAERELAQVRGSLASCNRVRRSAENEVDLLIAVAWAARRHLARGHGDTLLHIQDCLDRWEAGRDGGF